MGKSKLVIQHDLSKLSPEQATQYLRDVSEFIGLDPDMNGLDTIWMDNENGPGKSLVVYARRGTAEILRNVRGIEVLSLTNQEIRGSIVFTAIGKDKAGRQEIATGSKDISKFNGKLLDDAIMTASTRALRRLTMQFTSLGILDESEVKAMIGDTVNPAAGATLQGSPMVIPPMPKLTNNAPGKDVTPVIETTTVPVPLVAPVVITIPNAAPETPEQYEARIGKIRNDAKEFLNSKDAPASEPTPEKPKRARRKSNTVSLEGPEPEVVQSAPTQVNPAVPPQVEPAPAPTAPEVAPQPAAAPPVAPPQVAPPQVAPDYPGKPTAEQMIDYRKKISVYTSQLPSSVGLGSMPKMRAFIGKMSGTPTDSMTVDQWEEMISWFESFVERNQIKGLVTYINDLLGVK